MLSQLKISDLELFITAAHLKNLGKAAKHHHLSQSAASAAIQRVETAFGRPLCTHEKRQFRLTQEGESLLPRAEVWVRQLHEEVAKQTTRPIRLATTNAISRVIVPTLLALEPIELKIVRPDVAYGMISRGEADCALVLDNASWEGVLATEIGHVQFGLYSRNQSAKRSPVLLPEEQMEVLSLEQRWRQIYSEPLEIKARLPSWSLIADICKESDEIGFLPDFLALHLGLHPVRWQPHANRYRMLALHRHAGRAMQTRLDALIESAKSFF